MIKSPFFLADFQQIIQRKCGKMIKVNKQDVPDLVFSLLQVLLSGLIGVVSWKRPLSLVVSFPRTPPPVTLEPVSPSARRLSEHAGGVFIWPLVQVRPSSPSQAPPYLKLWVWGLLPPHSRTCRLLLGATVMDDEFRE